MRTAAPNRRRRSLSRAMRRKENRTPDGLPTHCRLQIPDSRLEPGTRHPKPVIRLSPSANRNSSIGTRQFDEPPPKTGIRRSAIGNSYSQDEPPPDNRSPASVFRIWCLGFVISRALRGQWKAAPQRRGLSEPMLITKAAGSSSPSRTSPAWDLCPASALASAPARSGPVPCRAT